MKASHSWVIAVLVVACASLAAANLSLRHQVQRLTKKNGELIAIQAPPVGSSVRAIVGYDLQDKPVRFEYSTSKDNSLFLLLSPTCEYCNTNWKYWRRLLADIHGTQVVFGDASGRISPEYFSAVGIPVPDKVVKISLEMKIAYNLTTVPTTIVFGPKGEVLGTWVGVLDDESVASVERLIGKKQ